MTDAIGAMAAVLSDLRSLANAAAAAPVSEPASPTATGAPSPVSFGDALRAAIGRVNDAVASANGAAQGFASGDRDIPLSDVMIGLETANLGLQLAANVRDKVVAAYTNIMNMQL